jgi:hypothetical protein
MERVREKGNGLRRRCYFNTGIRNINLQLKNQDNITKVVVAYFYTVQRRLLVHCKSLPECTARCARLRNMGDVTSWFSISYRRHQAPETKNQFKGEDCQFLHLQKLNSLLKCSDGKMYKNMYLVKRKESGPGLFCGNFESPYLCLIVWRF